MVRAHAALDALSAPPFSPRAATGEAAGCSLPLAAPGGVQPCACLSSGETTNPPSPALRHAAPMPFLSSSSLSSLFGREEGGSRAVLRWQGRALRGGGVTRCDSASRGALQARSSFWEGSPGTEHRRYAFAPVASPRHRSSSRLSRRRRCCCRPAVASRPCLPSGVRTVAVPPAAAPSKACAAARVAGAGARLEPPRRRAPGSASVAKSSRQLSRPLGLGAPLAAPPWPLDRRPPPLGHSWPLLRCGPFPRVGKLEGGGLVYAKSA